MKISPLILRFLPIFLGLTASFALSGQTVTKTYAPGFSVSVDGCGTYCNDLPGITFDSTDFTSGCAVVDVNITIRWSKTAGSCSIPAAGNPNHHEISFRLDGPDGTQVVLAPAGTWTDSIEIDSVITEFNDSALALPSGTPMIGSFLPVGGNLDDFVNSSPEGTWFLRAGDSALGAPLCIDSFSIQITAGNLLVVTASGTNNPCLNDAEGTATAIAGNGATPYQYLWNNGDTMSQLSGLPVGTYSITVTDQNGCMNEDSVVVGFDDAPPVFSFQTDTLVVASEFNTIVAPSGYATYLWSTGSTNQSTEVNASGYYFLTVTDGGECEAVDSVFVTITVGINSPGNAPQISVYPNPAHALLYVEIGQGEQPESITILTLDGRQMRDTSGNQPLNVSGFPAGIYVLKVEHRGAIWWRQVVLK